MGPVVRVTAIVHYPVHSLSHSLARSLARITGSNTYGGCTHAHRACPAANLSSIPSAAYVCQVNVPDQYKRMDSDLERYATKNSPCPRSAVASLQQRDLSRGRVLRRPGRLVIEGNGTIVMNYTCPPVKRYYTRSV